MKDPYFPVEFVNVAGIKSVKAVSDGDKMETGGALINVMAGQHPNGVVYYKVKDVNTGARVAYITDYERNKDAAVDAAVDDFVKGIDLVIMDSQYLEKDFFENFGHGKLEEVIDVAVDSECRALVVYHHDPNRSDDQLDDMLQMAKIRADARMEAQGRRPHHFRVYASYDGLAMEYSDDVKRFEIVQNGG